jgi:glycerophosphoryl diester phosphodiesterase
MVAMLAPPVVHHHRRDLDVLEGGDLVDGSGIGHDGPVAPLLPSRLDPPIGFAHRGARAHAPENTMESFELALRLGATGLESDVWLTADGVPVLDHDGVVGRVRRRPIRSIDRSDLPSHIPAVAEFFASFGTDFELSLDVKDPDAGAPTVALAMSADATMPSRLWLCDDDIDRLTSWRAIAPHVRLVDSTRLASQLQAAGIDAINLHHSDWNGGLVTLFHRFAIYAFGWDAQFDHTLDRLIRSGIDGVYSDHVDRMVDALARRERSPG